MSTTDDRRRTRMDPDARREQIVQAAAQEFSQRAYEDVAIADIAERIGVSEALIFRYFPTKADLHACLIRLAIADLRSRQNAALAELPPNTSSRDRVRISLLVYMDHIARYPRAWAAPLALANAEPRTSADIREAARGEYVERLRRLIGAAATSRQEYALWGYFGFLDAACLRWVRDGCKEDERWSVIDAALGALEGALGDWGG